MNLPSPHWYDAASQRTVMADLTGRTTSSYDNGGRLSKVTYPAGKRISYSYDSAGQRTRWIESGGGRFTTVYDAAGRRTFLMNPENQRTTWSYDNANRVTAIRLANGVRASYTYNDADQLTRLVNITGTGTTLSSFTYNLDPIGNRSKVTEADGTRVTWSYDKSYQLTRELRSGTNGYSVTYAYDPVGNRLTMRDSGTRTTYIFDVANQLKTSQDNTGRTTFTFDANGNQAVQNAPGGRTSYSWDYENKLTRVILSSGARNTFSYNADGKRVQKLDSTGTTNFIWDGDNVLQETDQTNTTQVTYTLEPLVYGNLVSQRRGSATGYYHFDGLGSTDRLTDGTGTALNNYIYRAFGVVQFSSETTTNLFRYVGQLGYYANPDLVQQHVRARSYDPQIARFVSTDPVGFTCGPNLYAYTGNLPTSEVDPEGLLRGRPLLGRRRRRCPPCPSFPCQEDQWINDPPPDNPGGTFSSAPPQPKVSCQVWICVNRIGLTPLAGHAYVVLNRGAGFTWGYRGGPSTNLGVMNKCKKFLTPDQLAKHGQLIGTQGPYDKGFPDHPENRDWKVEPAQRCRSVTVTTPNSCETIHNCFLATMKKIDNCCLPYVPVPFNPNNGCNSNCYAYWVLANCLKSNSPFVWNVPSILGINLRALPGWRLPFPNCFSSPKAL
jgi:RHS repeat-associated protein